MTTRNRLTIALFPAAAVLAIIVFGGCAPQASPPQPTSSTEIPRSSVAKDTAVQAGQRTTNAVPAEGTVAEITRPPTPGTVPYKDAIVTARLTEVQASSSKIPQEVVIYLWGMRDNRTTPASQIQKGQRVSVNLIRWDAVEDEYGSYNRVELTDTAAMTLPAFWGEIR